MCDVAHNMVLHLFDGAHVDVCDVAHNMMLHMYDGLHVLCCTCVMLHMCDVEHV